MSLDRKKDMNSDYYYIMSLTSQSLEILQLLAHRYQWMKHRLILLQPSQWLFFQLKNLKEGINICQINISREQKERIKAKLVLSNKLMSTKLVLKKSVCGGDGGFRVYSLRINVDKVFMIKKSSSIQFKVAVNRATATSKTSVGF
jgi:hypothetical protein